MGEETRELLQFAAVGLGIFLGCLWALIGLLLAGVGWVTVRQRIASIRWPQVPARIVASEVKEVRQLEENLFFQPVVRYVFAAEGQEMTSGQLSLVGKLYGSEKRARKKIEKYPVGMIVMARCNPEDPAEAVLEDGGGLVGFLFLFFGIGLAAAPVAAAQQFGLPAWPLAGFLATIVMVALLLDRASRKRLQKARRAGLYPPTGGGSDEDVQRLLRQGEKMLAIRLYREIHGTDLKTARARVGEWTDRSDKSP